MEGNIMNVTELNRDQLNELKQAYAEQLATDGITWGELAAATEIPDDIIFEHYADIDFVNDDFFCSMDE
jgi:hypothetical protein